MAFLNKEGLEHLWDNIIYKLSEKADKEYVDNAVANAGGGGGGGATPDWDQNDPAANDYIKNRPFYEENALVEMVSNLTTEDYNNGNFPLCNFVLGNKYQVIWNGEVYDNLTCYESEGYEAIGGDDYPFYIDDNGGGGLYIYGYEDNENFVVSIYLHGTIVHKLDTKYIPNDIQGDWNQGDISALDYIKNKPFGLFLGKMLNVCCDVTVLAEELSEYAPGVYTTPGYTHAGNFELGDFTYEVIIDGVSYYTQAVDGYSNYDYLGSSDFLSNPNESEFPFLIYKDGSGYLLMYLANEGPHTVKIIAYEGGYEFKQLDEKFIPDTIARKSDISENGGGVSSWNDLTDKPFSEEIFEPIVWDGNLEGHESVSVSGGYQWVLVSERFLEKDMLVGCTLTIHDGAAGTRDILVKEQMVDDSDEGYNIVIAEMIALVHSANEQYVAEDQSSNPFPKAGTYITYLSTDEFYVSQITFPPEIKTLDEKFIPDTIARKSDIPEDDGITSWNDLTDKPFYGKPALTITFDGNTEGKDVIQLARSNYIKISDEFLPSDQMMGVAVKFTNKNDGAVESDTITTTRPAPNSFGFQDPQSYGAYCDFSGAGSPAVIGINSDEERAGSIVTRGTYVSIWVKSSYYVSEVTFPSALKTLDEKFIPDTIARKSDVAGNEATDEEVINLIAQCNIVVPVTDETNCVYTDENEKILVI